MKRLFFKNSHHKLNQLKYIKTENNIDLELRRLYRN